MEHPTVLLPPGDCAEIPHLLSQLQHQFMGENGVSLRGPLPLLSANQFPIPEHSADFNLHHHLLIPGQLPTRTQQHSELRPKQAFQLEGTHLLPDFSGEDFVDFRTGATKQERKHLRLRGHDFRDHSQSDFAEQTLLLLRLENPALLPKALSGQIGLSPL